MVLANAAATEFKDPILYLEHPSVETKYNELIKSGTLDFLDDWSDLPLFGGEEPEDTAEIWSWDEARLIVGISSDSIEIISRNEDTYND